MSDQLATPWSALRNLRPLPPSSGVPALARTGAPGAAAAPDRAGAVVLVAPWSSYRLPMPTVLPAVDGLPGTTRAVASGTRVPRPRVEGAVPTLL